VNWVGCLQDRGHRPRPTFVALLVVLRLHRSVPTSDEPLYFLKRTSKVSTLKDLSRQFYCCCRRPQWPDGLRRGSEAACLLGLRLRIPPGVWMSVFSECCVLLGRGLCDELIARPEESYRVWCVWVWSRCLENEKALAPLEAVEPGKAAESRSSPTKVLPTWNLGVLTTDQRMLEIPVAPTTEAKQRAQNSQLELLSGQSKLLTS
jgi:hypothetical protein